MVGPDDLILLKTEANSLAMLAHEKAKSFIDGEIADYISYAQTASRWANVVFSLKNSWRHVHQSKILQTEQCLIDVYSNFIVRK